MRDIEILDSVKVMEILSEFGLSVGGWEQIEEIPNLREEVTFDLDLSKESLEQYYSIKEIASWILAPGWLIIKLDNSTFPLDDEVRLFNFLTSGGKSDFNLHQDRSFMIQDSPSRDVQVIMLLFLVINFNWHAHFVCQGSADSRWLSVLDGSIYFHGGVRDIEFAKEIKGRL